MGVDAAKAVLKSKSKVTGFELIIEASIFFSVTMFLVTAFPL